MSEQAEQLQERTMQFAVDVCELIKLLPAWEPGPTVGHQLAKSSTSVAMNYRSSRRARSHAEFTARTGIVADESDESLAWLEFSQRAKLLDARNCCACCRRRWNYGTSFRHPRVQRATGNVQSSVANDGRPKRSPQEVTNDP